MVDRKRKKVTKYRGSKTHGGGSMKKRRGAGHRGGRGRAGSGKRGDAKKPRYWSEVAPKGFTSLADNAVNTINVGHLNSMIENLARKNKVAQSGDAYVVNLEALGYERLLGGGRVTSKMTIKADSASARAIEKIEKAGGKIELEAKDSE